MKQERLIKRLDEVIKLDELALKLIRKEMIVENVSITNEPIETTRYGSGCIEYIPSPITEIETTLTLNDGTRITIEREVRR